jgi:ribosomal protein S18 acetylase RimI-like enzyme
MNIREFDYKQDLQSVLDLWQDGDPGIQLSPSDNPAEIKKKIQRDPDLFLVAVDDACVVGVVMGGFDGRRGMVYHLAVKTTYRGAGIGRALMEELERRLRLKGCLKYYLLVTKDNQNAISFYENLGCEIMNLFVLGKVIQ